MQPPDLYTWSQQNKIMACLALWFVGNSIEGALLQTGAFEIDLNGVPLWSKLKSGRLPQGEEFFNILNKVMKSKNDDQTVNPHYRKVSRDTYADDSTSFDEFNVKEDVRYE